MKRLAIVLAVLAALSPITAQAATEAQIRAQLAVLIKILEEKKALLVRLLEEEKKKQETFVVVCTPNVHIQTTNRAGQVVGSFVEKGKLVYFVVSAVEPCGDNEWTFDISENGRTILSGFRANQSEQRASYSSNDTGEHTLTFTVSNGKQTVVRSIKITVL